MASMKVIDRGTVKIKAKSRNDAFGQLADAVKSQAQQPYPAGVRISAAVSDEGFHPDAGTDIYSIPWIAEVPSNESDETATQL